MQFIYVVRQGETDANVAGQANDINITLPINAKGKAQSNKTGKYLKTRFSKKDKFIIYTSKSTRAIETAEIIADELDFDKNNIIQDERINETDNGLLSGSVKGDDMYNKFMKEYNKLPTDPIDFELSMDKFYDLLHKKFKNEPPKLSEKRVKSFYESLPNKKDIIQSMIRNLFNVSPKIIGDITNVSNCTITCITRKYNLITLPNTLHLK